MLIGKDIVVTTSFVGTSCRCAATNKFGEEDETAEILTLLFDPKHGSVTTVRPDIEPSALPLLTSSGDLDTGGD